MEKLQLIKEHGTYAVKQGVKVLQLIAKHAHETEEQYLVSAKKQFAAVVESFKSNNGTDAEIIDEAEV